MTFELKEIPRREFYLQKCEEYLDRIPYIGKMVGMGNESPELKYGLDMAQIATAYCLRAQLEK